MIKGRHIASLFAGVVLFVIAFTWIVNRVRPLP